MFKKAAITFLPRLNFGKGFCLFGLVSLISLFCLVRDGTISFTCSLYQESLACPLGTNICLLSVSVFFF